MLGKVRMDTLSKVHFAFQSGVMEMVVWMGKYLISIRVKSVTLGFAMLTLLSWWAIQALLCFSLLSYQRVPILLFEISSFVPNRLQNQILFHKILYQLYILLAFMPEPSPVLWPFDNYADPKPQVLYRNDGRTRVISIKWVKLLDGNKWHSSCILGIVFSS